MSLPPISLEDFATDPALGSFTEASPGQKLVLRALGGQSPADSEQHKLFETLAGRPWSGDLARRPRSTVALVMGVSSGKSVIAALFLLWRCLFASLKRLRAGQPGIALLVAPDARLASIPLNYARGVIASSPLIAAEVESETADSIRFKRGTTMTVLPATFAGRATRGFRYVAAVLEEIAFFRSSDLKINDQEVVRSIRPRLLPDAALLAISTPYARNSWIGQLHEAEFGVCKRALVLQAPTGIMRPDIDPGVIAEARAEDPIAAAAEYDAQFIADVRAAFDPQAVAAVVVRDRRELPPCSDLLGRYHLHLDPSGGGPDWFAAAIGHRQGEVAVIDVLRRWKATNPSGVVAEIAALARRYGITTVMGDRYSGQWVQESFRAERVNYEVCPKPTNDLYLDLVAVINSRQIELPDDEVLVRELTALQRRPGTSGRDRIEHPRGAHDDVANVAAGIAWRLVGEGGPTSTITVYQPSGRELRRLEEKRAHNPFFQVDNFIARLRRSGSRWGRDL